MKAGGQPSGNISPGSDAGRTKDIIAQKVGLGSGKTLEAAQRVVEHGTPELVEAWPIRCEWSILGAGRRGAYDTAPTLTTTTCMEAVMATPDSTVLTRPSNADTPETVLLSVREVRAALAQITESYPELAQAMRICDAMLVRLETEKDEARLGLGLATERARKGDIAGTIELMEGVAKTLGKRNSRQPLTA